jgi:starvation-inducible DNA-binding protein
MAKVTKLKPREGRAMAAALDTPTDIPAQAVKELSKALNGLLADTFALYLKTKNFHWHVSGPHFRSYHLLLDEQAAEIYETTDVIAERVRKLGGTTLRSIGDISRNQTLKDNNDDFVPPLEMLRELMNDNKATIASMRKIHELCDKHDDVATASLLEKFIDAAESRTGCLSESSDGGAATAHLLQ